MSRLKRSVGEYAQGGFADIPAGYPSANIRQLVPRKGYAQYSFAVDGGAISTITPKTTWLLPQYAIVYNGSVNVTTACVGAGGTLAIGTSAGSASNSILTATAVASLTLDAVIVPTCIATPFKLSAAGNITVTIASTAFTAGVVEIMVDYWLPVNA